MGKDNVTRWNCRMVMPKNPCIGSASGCPCKLNCKAYTVVSKSIIVIFFSYTTLLTLTYGSRMGKNSGGLPYGGTGEAERVVEMELFLNEYPHWNIGSPHRSVILHKMFLHAASQGQKEAECMCHWGCPGNIRETQF